MKGYFVCDGNRDWWSCWGVLENGFCFGQHVCSHPNFAPGDLYYGRPERIAALKEVFGVGKDDLTFELIVVRSKEDVPTWWNDHALIQDKLAAEYEKYSACLDKAKRDAGGEGP